MGTTKLGVSFYVRANIRNSVKGVLFRMFFFGENFTIAIHLENELCFVTLLVLFGNYNSLESSGVY